jgi:hypothetical protein
MHNMDLLEAGFTTTINPGVLKDAMKAAGASSGDLWKLSFTKLRIIDGFNLRVHNAQYSAKIEEYAESLFNEGWMANKPMSGLVQQDPKTGENVPYIFDGHTRLLAIPLANARLAAAGRPLIDEVTVIAVPSKKPNSKEPISMVDLTVAMVQGNKGNPHSAYECAIACKRLADDGLAVNEIARRLTISGEWVNSLLLLMSAPKELRERVANEALTVTLAVQLLKEFGDDASVMVEEAAAKKEAEGKPVRITKKNIAPASKFSKAVKRSAPKLYAALDAVKQDPAFAGLSDAAREKILSLFEELQKAKDDGDVDHSKQTTIFDSENPNPDEQEKAAA